jgi:hypothetical protein
MHRPLISSVLEKSCPRDKAGIYDGSLQLTVNAEGMPVLADEATRAQTRTFVERDPSDPAEPKPPKPQTFTRTVQEPADISGFSALPSQPPRTVTKVIHEPADVSGFSVRPPQPPRTVTEVVAEPADVVRARHKPRNPVPADPWGDNAVTGAVDF